MWLQRLCTLIFVLALFAQTKHIIAQPTYKTVVKATTPEDDSKPNSDSIPEVIPMDGEFKQVIILRYKFNTDLLKGLEESVAEKGIQNAVILSGIGSVRNYHIHSVSNNTFPSENIYIKDVDAPADLASINGYVIDGRVHAHVTLTNEKGAFGGHLEYGTTVFTFAIVTLGILEEGMDLSRVDDKTYR
jgi:predicted DNA-binding protein with PD1-like motif